MENLSQSNKIMEMIVVQLPFRLANVNNHWQIIKNIVLCRCRQPVGSRIIRSWLFDCQTSKCVEQEYVGDGKWFISSVRKSILTSSVQWNSCQCLLWTWPWALENIKEPNLNEKKVSLNVFKTKILSDAFKVFKKMEFLFKLFDRTVHPNSIDSISVHGIFCFFFYGCTGVFFVYEKAIFFF